MALGTRVEYTLTNAAANGPEFEVTGAGSEEIRIGDGAGDDFAGAAVTLQRARSDDSWTTFDRSAEGAVLSGMTAVTTGRYFLAPGRYRFVATSTAAGTSVTCEVIGRES